MTTARPDFNINPEGRAYGQGNRSVRNLLHHKRRQRGKRGSWSEPLAPSRNSEPGRNCYRKRVASLSKIPRRTSVWRSDRRQQSDSSKGQFLFLDSQLVNLAMIADEGSW